ncbi:MAG: phytoene desaturase [Chitinophagaceae bacterium]|nr:phytoene desaturase [Chitinophagaceae bacterium]
MPLSKKSILIIGAGISGMSAACHLAKAGFNVHVIEKNNNPGGRANIFEKDGFVFDMGPSWYWMPDVFETFFNHFGKKTSDYFTLQKLSPSYQVIWNKNEADNVFADDNELKNLFEKYEKNSYHKLQSFLAEAKYKYEVGMNDMVDKPALSWFEFADWRVMKSFFKLDLLVNMKKHIAKKFSHPRLVQLLSFPVLFLGAKPQNTPALYSLMNYADLKLGTWYPENGMFSISKAMYDLACELGVSFTFNEEINSFDYDNNKIIAANSKNKKHIADYIISAADYHHIDQNILEPQYANYSKKYWESRTLAPSALIFYLGINKKINKLQHHNLFFDADFDQHANEIYDKKSWPTSPLFYVCCPSKTDKNVAPEGNENLFILMPCAVDIEDNEEVRKKYFDILLNRMEEFCGEALKNYVVFNQSFAHKDFKSLYHSFKGNAYGLANTLRQTAVWKPQITNKKLKNLFFTGQLTVPGPGLPPAIISGKIVADYINKIDKKN